LAEAEAAARSLLAVGVGCVVVTLGANGALIVSTDGTRHIPGQQVDVVDTTGAGDAFSGALAVAVAEGRTIVEAVTFANAAAALQVTKVGTAPAMPYRLEVEAFLERGSGPSHTLEVFHGDTLVFSSDSHWLHPLFELEAFLASSTYNPGGLEVYDKIVGRAAALLMVRLGVGQVHARVLSELGREILQYHDMTYTYDEVVDRIACDTEALLREVLDPEAAYVMLRERVERGE
ncbi:MAG: PfkB family carbohydrate kinase, partial [Anaerolineae bacterium]